MNTSNIGNSRLQHLTNHFFKLAKGTQKNKKLVWRQCNKLYHFKNCDIQKKWWVVN